MTRFTFALYVNPALPVNTVAELVAHAQARPGQLNYGSVGTGSAPHLAMELLKPWSRVIRTAKIRFD